VDYAVRRQLDSGASLSLATELEYKLAERLKRHIPCCEQVRFGKNGTDVTTAAVRLARHLTGRDMVLTSGYHGWPDWAIAQDPLRNLGVPKAVRELTTVLRHGDTQAAEREISSKKYACVIVEPETDPEFLKRLRVLCNATRTLLIFDEIITGFRFGLGGAQKLYGVTPDLATFGKSMANGLPISALVGKRIYMKEMERICFSGTFFGETLALAAALASIEKMEREPVLDRIHGYNQVIAASVREVQEEYGINCFRVHGQQLSRLTFITVGMHSKDDLRTLWMQEMIKNGVLIINSHNFMYAHTEADLQRVIKAYDAACKVLSEAIREGNVTDRIVGRSIESAANVRAS
jgi:glutamate-1-semialdehyde aminotransferase